MSPRTPSPAEKVAADSQQLLPWGILVLGSNVVQAWKQEPRFPTRLVGAYDNDQVDDVSLQQLRLDLASKLNSKATVLGPLDSGGACTMRPYWVCKDSRLGVQKQGIMVWAL